jgi:hypothetical protein
VTALRLHITKSATIPSIVQFVAYEANDPLAPLRESGKAEEIPIESWKDVRLSQDWRSVEIDLTPAIRKPGEYIIEIQQADRGGTLETANAMLLIADVEAPRHITPLDLPNAWRIQRTDQVTDDEKGVTTLRLQARCLGSGNCETDMGVRKSTP